MVASLMFSLRATLPSPRLANRWRRTRRTTSGRSFWLALVTTLVFSLLPLPASADGLCNLFIVMIGATIYDAPKQDEDSSSFCSKVIMMTLTPMFPYLKDESACWTMFWLCFFHWLLATAICMKISFAMQNRGEGVVCGARSWACLCCFGVWACCCPIDAAGTKVSVVGQPIGGTSRGKSSRVAPRPAKLTNLNPN